MSSCDQCLVRNRAICASLDKDEIGALNVIGRRRTLAPAACDILPEGGAKQFTLPFSRQQIADVLGLTIETVSRQFTRLRGEGIIDLPSRRDVVIVDKAALIAESGG